MHNARLSERPSKKRRKVQSAKDKMLWSKKQLYCAVKRMQEGRRADKKCCGGTMGLRK